MNCPGKEVENTMYELQPKTKKNIEACLALEFDDIVKIDSSDELQWVESIRKSKVEFPSTRDTRKNSRGNPLLSRRRLRTMAEIDKGLAEIVKRNKKRRR